MPIMYLNGLILVLNTVIILLNLFNIFYFFFMCSNVKDIHDLLEISVYDEDKRGAPDLLGRVSIPLLHVRPNNYFTCLLWCIYILQGNMLGSGGESHRSMISH